MDENGERPIMLAEFPTEALAAIFISTLREDGIEAVMTGAMTAGFRTEAPGMVRVLVHEADEANARKLLSDFRNTDRDENQPS